MANKIMLRVAPQATEQVEEAPVSNNKKVMLKVAGDPAPSAPAGYKPLSVQQRKDWNSFLDYLEQQKAGGSPDLDKRDQSLGLQYLEKYRQMNPKTSISKEIIPHVQYEQQMLRKGNSFPGLSAEELAYVKQGLSPAYLNKPVSDVDSWLGSLTSREYYPMARRGTNTGQQYDFGVNFEDYVRSLKNADLQEKYRVNR